MSLVEPISFGQRIIVNTPLGGCYVRPWMLGFEVALFEWLLLSIHVWFKIANDFIPTTGSYNTSSNSWIIKEFSFNYLTIDFYNEMD